MRANRFRLFGLALRGLVGRLRDARDFDAITATEVVIDTAVDGCAGHCNADMLLAGHYHISHTGDITTRYPIPGYSALVVHAGTATSVRGRGELNAFNVIRTEQSFVNIDRHVWQRDIATFQLLRQERFQRTEEGWISLK